jgi:hypothetical protein
MRDAGFEGTDVTATVRLRPASADAVESSEIRGATAAGQLRPFSITCATARRFRPRRLPDPGPRIHRRST